MCMHWGVLSYRHASCSCQESSRRDSGSKNRGFCYGDGKGGADLYSVNIVYKESEHRPGSLSPSTALGDLTPDPDPEPEPEPEPGTTSCLSQLGEELAGSLRAYAVLGKGNQRH